MIILIDSDILVYRVGFAAQKKDPEGNMEVIPEGFAFARITESLINIRATLNDEPTRIFLTSTDHSNYRYSIFPEYKGNRTAPKPVLYDALRKHLVEQHGAEIVYGEEADDRIGIEAMKNPEAIIVTIDKDLDQIPRTHYNFVKGLLYDVTPEEGMKFFYHQLLMGDRSDNIPGLTGIGQIKAEKALAQATTEQECFNVAKALYQKEFPESWEQILLRNGRLLKIRQKEGEIWCLPNTNDLSEVRRENNNILSIEIEK